MGSAVRSALLAAIFLSFFVKVSRADTQNVSGVRDSSILEESGSRPAKTLRLGASIFEYNYKEDLRLPQKSTENGLLPGLALGYRVDSEASNWYSDTSLNFSRASTTYDGSVENLDTGEVSPRKSTTDDTLLDLESDFGLTLAWLGRSTPLRCYTGLGFHLWQRDLQGDGGYSETYDWLVFPVGLILERQFGDSFSVALDFSGRLSFLGRMSAGGQSFALGSRPGYKAQLPLRARVSRHAGLIFSPWMEYSAIGASEMETLVLSDGSFAQGNEPPSRTYQYGTSFSLAFDL